MNMDELTPQHSMAFHGVENPPPMAFQGRCVAFWSRSRTGHLDPASWHGGAAVGLGSAKWTLQRPGPDSDGRASLERKELQILLQSSTRSGRIDVLANGLDS